MGEETRNEQSALKSFEDSSARESIYSDLDSSIFVDAGAGTGKTYVLTERVFNLVDSGKVQLQDLAVVTFTEKAARELKDRLRDKFSGSDKPAAKVALTQVDSAAIGTLHSFALRILASFPVQARLPLTLEVAERTAAEADENRELQQIFAQLGEDPKTRALLVAAVEAGVSAGQLIDLIGQLSNNFDLIEKKLLPLQGSEADLNVPAKALTRLQDILSQCTDKNDRLFAILADLAWHLEQTVDAVSAEAADRVGLGQKLYELGQTKLGSSGSKKAWGRTGKEVRDEVKEHVLAPLGQVGSALLTWWLLPLVQQMGALVLENAKTRKSSGKVRFHDLLVLTRDLLATNAQVRQSLQEQYKIVFLDEFQDTDPLQIEIALRIAGGKDADQQNWADISIPEGSLFIVGDPKQSIYAFRRAEVRLYKQVQEWMGVDAGAQLLGLSANFRSTPQLIDWVNEALIKVLSETETQAVFQALTHGKETPVLKGPSVVVLGPPTDDEAEADAAADGKPEKKNMEQVRAEEAADIAALIKEAIDDRWEVRDGDDKPPRPLHAGDIAILFKTRSSMPAVETALAQAGIPYYSEARTRAYMNPTCAALLDTLKYLDRNVDQADLVRALRSPLFGCSDPQLAAYKAEVGGFWPRPENSVSEETQPEERNQVVDTTPVAQALEYLDTLSKSARSALPSELLERLVQDRFALSAVTATNPGYARETYASVRNLIDDARAFEQEQWGTLRQYLAWADTKKEQADTESEPEVPEHDLNAVKLTTIHASKGLQYPMVILPSTAKIDFPQTGSQIIWEDQAQIRLCKALETEGFPAASELRRKLAVEEVERLLYVAATRAEDHLVVSLYGKSSGGKSTSLADIWNKADLESLVGLYRPKQVQPAGAIQADKCELLSKEEYARLSAKASESSVFQDRATPTGLPKALRAQLMGGGVADAGAGDPGLGDDGLGDGGLPDAGEFAADLEKSGKATTIGQVVHETLAQLVSDGVGGDEVGDGAGDDRLQDLIHKYAAIHGLPASESETALQYVRSALACPQVNELWAAQTYPEIPMVWGDGSGLVIRGIADLVGIEGDEQAPKRAFVLDYKTDRIVNAADIERHARHHRPQLRIYALALAQALGIEPSQVETYIAFLSSDAVPATVVSV